MCETCRSPPVAMARCAIVGRCSSKSDSRRSGAGGSIRSSSMSAIAAISPAFTATSMPGPPGSRKCRGRSSIRRCFSRAQAHCNPRYHRRRAGAQPALSPAGQRRARNGRAGDGPLQSDGDRGARSGGPSRVSRRRAGRDRRVAALLPRRQCRPPTRQGRVRGLNPRAAAPQRPRIWARAKLARSEPGL